MNSRPVLLREDVIPGRGPVEQKRLRLPEIKRQNKCLALSADLESSYAMLVKEGRR